MNRYSCKVQTTLVSSHAPFGKDKSLTQVHALQQEIYVEAGGTIEQLNHFAHRGLAGLREVWEQLLNHIEHNGLTGHKLPTLKNLKVQR